MRVLLLVFVLIFLGCKGQKEESPKARVQEVTPKLTEEENLGRMRAYVFTEKDIYIINLEDNTFKKISIESKIQDAFLSEDTIWVAGSSLFWVANGKIIEEMELPANYKKVIKDGADFYVLTEGSILRLPDQRRFTLFEEPIKFDVKFGKIWVMDDEGVSIYRGADFKELHRLLLEKPLDFVLSPYGIRVYIATTNRLNIFDTQTANYIADIPIETGEYVSLHITGDKLYCLTESRLYKIDRTTNQIEAQLKIGGGERFFVSRNGKYGVVVRDSIISFFEAQNHEITKNIKLNVVDITTTIRDSRIYCLTPDELIAISPDKLQAISRLKLIGGRKIIIK